MIANWQGLLTVLFFLAAPAALAGEWKRLPSLPDKEGFAGPFAGVSHGALIVAGGANFPDKKPWDGGKKVWYDSVFVLEKPNGKWRVAGKLPRPLGYGISVSHGQGVVCVGGSDSRRHYADAFRLERAGGKLVLAKLPPLPIPLASGCGALVGDSIYIAGGQEQPDSPKASKATWRLDLSARSLKWERLDDCPGPGRILAIAAAFDRSFWVVGGAELVAGTDGAINRRYLSDGYRYSSGKGWKRIADLPHPVLAAPSPAPTDASGFIILGGDDGSQVGAAPGKHRGFGKQVLHYESKSGKWTVIGELPAPRVTVPAVQWGRSWVAPSGEVRPGVRSPEVWSFTPGNKE